jgi:quercetin dioxygenase-like cupin family protein
MLFLKIPSGAFWPASAESSKNHAAVVLAPVILHNALKQLISTHPEIVSQALSRALVTDPWLSFKMRKYRMNSEITRQLLQTTTVEGMPGWETRLFLITYPAGADGSGHSHPVPGIGYVLEGTMVSAFDNDAEEIILAGQSFQDKASFHRVSRNGSVTEPMRFLIAYTVKTGEPNTTWPIVKGIQQ